MQNKPGERLTLGVLEVSIMLGVSRQAIYNAINRGDLRSFKVGKRRLFTHNAIQDLIRTQEERATYKGSNG